MVGVDRGGQLTYHGPGQLVGYPIMRIDDVHRYLRTIERAIIAALSDEGVHGRSRRDEGIDYTGVWVGNPARRQTRDRKIALIGVHVSRGVTTHGFAVNVDMDLDPFSWVIACGLPEVEMTSIVREVAPGCRLDAEKFRTNVTERFCEAYDRRARVLSPRQSRTRALARAGAGMNATRSRANPGGRDVLRRARPEVRPLRERKPPWLKSPAPGGTRYRELSELIRAESLHTVCQEAACPNVGECWEREPRRS